MEAIQATPPPAVFVDRKFPCYLKEPGIGATQPLISNRQFKNIVIK
jgi:hypothetical protein